MSHNYMSESELAYLEERKQRAEYIDRSSAERNNMLVGEVRTYKGFSYQMKQHGLYACVNLPKNDSLGGLYTSVNALRAAIDDLEKSRALLNKKL